MFDRVKMLGEIIAQSVREIADATKINESTLRNILLGARKCGLDEYVRICGFLGAPIGKFIKRDGDDGDGSSGGAEDTAWQ
jgi:transcriptional regulator with XRE-family HTH domain